MLELQLQGERSALRCRVPRRTARVLEPGGNRCCGASREQRHLASYGTVPAMRTTNKRIPTPAPHGARRRQARLPQHQEHTPASITNSGMLHRLTQFGSYLAVSPNKNSSKKLLKCIPYSTSQGIHSSYVFQEGSFKTCTESSRFPPRVRASPPHSSFCRR